MKLTKTLCLLTALLLPVTAAVQAKEPSELKSKSVSQGYAMRIQLNTASVTQLQALKGVGEAKARAIIDYREAHGGFKSVDELTKVKGIGDKILKDNKGLISL
ncbi:helix-hairpin-helix domain-containing protein [Shewanella corallii]|uniref:Helix-hairpin-helix domain-containing protein n=1 Tax=Shewanella corallii TaxID=560080 RepID=A0ABT0NCH3_9GAMM|nr:helix-hairpin-helix domain-containing protein [Shewanella corallii]MCL2915805.1 helix-hairpin-helix domain-containing protein [Shewanella corallii]